MAEHNDNFSVTVELGRSGYTSDITAGDHLFRADEPKSVGGADLGPSPYDLLLASLGTCTAMTLRMYADRKNWPLEGVIVRLAHTRQHAADCADCESEDGYITRITRTVEIHGDELDDDQRARLQEIADKCPVHKTLTGEVKIDSTAAA